jgi:hypothetical protein
MFTYCLYYLLTNKKPQKEDEMPFIEFNFPIEYNRINCLAERIREEIYNRNVEKMNIIIYELTNSLSNLFYYNFNYLINFK